jgi:hypothetical protein
MLERVVWVKYVIEREIRMCNTRTCTLQAHACADCHDVNHSRIRLCMQDSYMYMTTVYSRNQRAGCLVCKLGDTIVVYINILLFGCCCR